MKTQRRWTCVYYLVFMLAWFLSGWQLSGYSFAERIVMFFLFGFVAEKVVLGAYWHTVNYASQLKLSAVGTTDKVLVLSAYALAIGSLAHFLVMYFVVIVTEKPMSTKISPFSISFAVISFLLLLYASRSRRANKPQLSHWLSCLFLLFIFFGCFLLGKTTGFFRLLENF